MLSKRPPATKITTKMSDKVAVTLILLTAVAGVSFVSFNLFFYFFQWPIVGCCLQGAIEGQVVTQEECGEANDWQEGTCPEPSPTSPSTNLGCCDWRDGPTFETKKECDGKPRGSGTKDGFWWPSEQSKPAIEGGPVESGKPCKINCPDNTVTCGDYCCIQGQRCTEKLGTKYCTADNCPPQYPKLCKANNRNTCCKTDERCGKKKVGVWPATAEIAVCVPPDDSCDSDDPHYCGAVDNEDGSGKINVCCSSLRPNCKVINGIPMCLPDDSNKCDKDTEDYCSGGGISRCCPKGTCRYQPGNGQPFCDIRWE